MWDSKEKLPDFDRLMFLICEIIAMSDGLSRNGYNSEALREQNRLEEERTNVNCSKCLDELKYKTRSIRELECGHIYHIECIFIWLKPRKTQTCPMCVQPVSNNFTDYIQPRDIKSQKINH